MLELLEPAIEPIVLALGAIVAYYISRLGHRVLVKTKASQAEKDAFDAVMAGVEYAYETFVREAKEASGGKLTAVDRRAALDLAITHAKSVASDEGKAFLETMVRERVGGWVKTILARWQ